MDPIDAFYERYNRGDLEAAMSLFCDDAVLRTPFSARPFAVPPRFWGFSRSTPTSSRSRRSYRPGPGGRTTT